MRRACSYLWSGWVMLTMASCTEDGADKDAIAYCQLIEGDVRFHPERDWVWKTIDTGHRLAVGDWVRTGPESRARIVFADNETKLDVTPNSTVIIEPPSVSAGENRVSIKSGLVRSVIPLTASDDTLVLSFPSGKSVRVKAGKDGSELRVTVKEDQKTEIAVLKGSAVLSTDSGDRAVDEGQAQDIQDGRAVGRLVKLAPFPELVRPKVDARTLVPKGGSVELTWESVPEASGYSVQVSRDGNWNRTEWEQRVKRPRASFFPRAAGTYFWRVRSISQDGREGEFGFARRIFVETRPSINALENPPDKAVLTYERRFKARFEWKGIKEVDQYELVIYRQPSNQVTLRRPTRRPWTVVENLVPGRYTWGVFAIEGKTQWPMFSSPHALRIVKQKAMIRGPRRITFE